jgi:hypothetical protein
MYILLGRTWRGIDMPWLVIKNAASEALERYQCIVMTFVRPSDNASVGRTDMDNHERKRVVRRATGEPVVYRSVADSVDQP